MHQIKENNSNEKYSNKFYQQFKIQIRLNSKKTSKNIVQTK